MLHVLLVHTQAPQVDSSIEPAIKKKGNDLIFIRAFCGLVNQALNKKDKAYQASWLFKCDAYEHGARLVNNKGGSV